MGLSVLKICSPKAEVFFVEEKPLAEKRLKTPSKGYLLGGDVINQTNISLPLQALRILGYQDQKFPYGLLIATSVIDQITNLFGKDRIKDPLDEVDERVLSQVEGLMESNVVMKRIERVRFELFPVTAESFEMMKKITHNNF